MITELILDVPLSEDIMIESTLNDVAGFTRVSRFIVMRDSLYHDITSLCEIKVELWMGARRNKYLKIKLLGEESNLIMVKLILDAL